MTECAVKCAGFRDILLYAGADFTEYGVSLPDAGIEQRSKAGDGGGTEKQNFRTIGHAACSWAVWACLRSTRCTVAVDMRWPFAISRRLWPRRRSCSIAALSRTSGWRPMC